MYFQYICFFMCICMYTCTCSTLYTWTYICIDIHHRWWFWKKNKMLKATTITTHCMYTNKHTFTQINSHLHMQTDIMYIYIHIYKYMYIHIYICIYIMYIYIYIYIYIACNRQWCRHRDCREPPPIPHSVYKFEYTYKHTYAYTYTCVYKYIYGVASISRLLKMIGLFCKRAL